MFLKRHGSLLLLLLLCCILTQPIFAESSVNTLTTGATKPVTVDRLQTPEGWFVVVRFGDNGVSTTYVPDKDHTWIVP